MASALPVVKLQLSLHASGLPRSGAVRTPPDAFAQVAIIPSQYATGEQPIHLGSTEITKRSPNPQWAKVFVIEYEYGTQLSFFVDVLTSKGDNSKSIGGANFEVGDILGSKNKTKAKRLRKGGCIFAHIEQSTSEGSDGMISFQLSALRLECKGGLMRADPSTFFEVSRQTQTSFGNKWNVIYRSNPVIESLKPTWDRAEVDLETFCNCDLDRAILISVYIFRKRGNHSLLGSFETTPNCLIEKGKKGSEREWHESTYNLQKDEYKAYEEAGCIAVMEGSIVIDGKENSVEIMPLVDQEQVFEAEVAVNGSEDQQEDEEKDIPGTSIISLASLQLDRSSIGTVLELQASKAMPTFTAYVDSGLDIDLCVALDFTSSNGDPRIPGTLHHNSDGALNDYEETILSVGGAIAKYSLDKKFPVWGFGARYGGEVRHIFQCGQSSPVYDVDGILDAYRSVFQTDLTMSGPTVISRVIQAAAARANRCHRMSQAETKLRYCVLLVLTDGVLNPTNLNETQQLLSSVSGLPLSVVIIGIGMADFNAMQTLEEAGEVAGATAHSNVTFAPFRPHQHDPQSLSRAALKKLPDQIVHHFVQNNIFPDSHRRKPSIADSIVSELTIE